MNNVTLVGRLARAAEVSVVGSKNRHTTTVTIAVNRAFKNSDGSRDADFIQVVAWGANADVLANYTTKGSLVGVEGELRSRSYEKDGKTVYVTEVLATQISLLESKSATEARKEA